ncbi:hypothetical protein [Roseibium sp. Sym1]|uniref:hypothetical protein n=1 Tax=Roseibium sp. Sym1 TaxID=3016006 RepID=UPI0022B3B419|nr:hypothetical protein [Roseibium sp. Sym1]
MKVQTLAAILIVVSVAILGFAGYQWPFVFAVFMQFPHFLFLFLGAVAGTIFFGFALSSAVAGILFALGVYLMGVSEPEALLGAAASFIVPLAVVQLLVEAVKYLRSISCRQGSIPK